MNLPSLSVVTSLKGAPDVVVVGLADAAGTAVIVGAPDAWSTESKDTFGVGIEDLAQRMGATTKPGSAVAVPGPQGLIVVVGLGDADVTPDRVQRACANGVRRALEASGERAVSIAISLEAHEPEILAAAGMGALLACYRYDKAGTPKPTASVASLTLVGPAAAKGAVESARVAAEGVCLARDWVNTPPNVLYPESFAEAARESVKGLKVTVEVLDDKALAKGGFGGILAVGGGSARPPRLVTLTYAPRGAQAHLVLVGKGITFDSGGLNLKPAEGMLTMKMDMGGAAAVIAAIRAIAQLGLRVKVTALAALAENMPSSTAFRPSDVLVMHSGTTVENANSDAEGRLVLADALSYAGSLNPDFLVDIATLTGAAQVALGDRTAALMAGDSDAADTVLDAAEAAGESFWQLPIPVEMAEALTSEVADLKSSGPRVGGALIAAAFLREFVGDATPWVHLDIAGPAWSDKSYDHIARGGTGVGVRTLIELARSMAR